MTREEKAREFDKMFIAKKETKSKYFKVKDGISRVWVLPAKGDKMPVAGYHYHMFGKKEFINCLQDVGEDCPICNKTFQIWDNDSEDRKNKYRDVKQKPGYTMLIIELDRDGNQISTPKLFTPAKTLVQRFNKDWVDGKEGALVIVKNTDKQFPDYSDSYIDTNIQIQGDIPETDIDIHSIKEYDRDKATKAIDDLLSQLGVASSNNEDVDDDDDISAYKQKLMDDLI
jgi:hypothetical protein